MGLGGDGTLHGTYESRSCLFPLGRPVSRKACKTKTKTKNDSFYIRKRINSYRGLVWDTSMAAVSLFWDTNRKSVNKNDRDQVL